FSPDVRIKGLAPHLIAYLKTSQGVQELKPDAFVRRGDLIQLAYAAGDARYGVIFSVDGRGTITWHLPAGATTPAGLAPSLERQGQLPVSYELDDAPGFERFFLVTSEKPFDMAGAANAARALSQRAGSAETAGLSLPAGVKQYSLLLKKRGNAP
ncbi:MAG TPA: ActD-like protein, partial [Spirochaetia bacterium]|nr:ActD-like protein [Spirochaetia bacterium]